MHQELDPCRVHGPGGELVADGFVREQGPDHVVVEAAGYAGAWLHAGDPATVRIKSPALGSCTYDAVVLSTAPGRLRLGDLRLRERVQLRSAARVTTSLPHRATRHVQDVDGGVREEEVDVVVLDVSATGVRLRCAEELPEGTRLTMTFSAARRPLPMVLQVLRSQPLRADRAYGCRLVEADERLADELHRFVLDEQRRQAALRRDLR